jgi:hypothetical protein
MRSTPHHERLRRLSGVACLASVVLLIAACTEPAGQDVRSAAPTGSLTAPVSGSTSPSSDGGPSDNTSGSSASPGGY